MMYAASVRHCAAMRQRHTCRMNVMPVRRLHAFEVSGDEFDQEVGPVESEKFSGFRHRLWETSAGVNPLAYCFSL
jgi:hypothetical protein